MPLQLGCVLTFRSKEELLQERLLIDHLLSSYVDYLSLINSSIKNRVNYNGESKTIFQTKEIMTILFNTVKLIFL
jgi:hypothetical protein